jgi:hypothetical protein
VRCAHRDAASGRGLDRRRGRARRGGRRLGRGRLPWSLRSGGRRWEEAQRVVVGVAASRVADSEVEVRRGRRAGARCSDRSDAVAGPQAVALAHRRRCQVEVGGVEAAVRGADAHGQSRGAGRAREADLAARCGDHRRPDLPRDVDPSVLARRVRVGAVAVGRDHLASERPDPFGPRRWGEQGEREQGRGGGEERAAHGRRP